MKNSNSEQEVQVWRSENQNSTPAFKILFCPELMPNQNIRLRPEDLFENGLILEKVGKLFEEIYFNKNMDENLATYCKFIESMGTSTIKK